MKELLNNEQMTQMMLIAEYAIHANPSTEAELDEALHVENTSASCYSYGRALEVFSLFVENARVGAVVKALDSGLCHEYAKKENGWGLIATHKNSCFYGVSNEGKDDLLF